MLSKDIGFARYSRGLCWAVAGIWLAIAVLSFTSESPNSTLNGILWTLGAAAFAVCALFMGKSSGDSSAKEAPSND